MVSAKHPPSCRALARGAARSALWALAFSYPPVALFSGDDAGSAFQDKARGELLRMKKNDDDTEKDRTQQSELAIPTNPVVSPVDLHGVMMERVQKRTDTRDEEEKERDKEEAETKRNWLVDGVEKMSGEKKLTENERKALLEPGSGTRLIDRMVATREDQEAKQSTVDRSAREFKKQKLLDEENDRTLEKWTGVATPKSSGGPDALERMEKSILDPGSGERSGMFTRGASTVSGSESAPAPVNPYLQTVVGGKDLFSGSPNAGMQGRGRAVSSRSGGVPAGAGTGKSGTPNFEAFSGLSPATGSKQNPYLSALELPSIRQPQIPSQGRSGNQPIFNASGLPKSSGTGRTSAIPDAPVIPNRKSKSPEQSRAEEYKQYFPQIDPY